MPDFAFYVITDRSMCPAKSLTARVEEALKAGARAVQLREKDLPGSELLALAHELRELTRRYDARLFINDRLDVAVLAGADGLHCPESGIPPSVVRSMAPQLLVATSVHDPETAKAAEEEGADLLVYGPVYDTPSKQGLLEPRGLDALQQLCRTVRVPVFALGGITPERAQACIERGASGIAVQSAIMKAGDMEQTVNQYRQHIGSL